MQEAAALIPNASELASQLRMPDFFIIGAAKCGTTTLYKYLCRHPSVFMSTPKEMSFFSKDHVYAQGLEWYAELFAAAKPTQICGEASTTYTRWPHYQQTAQRLAAVQPNAKLVYIVRNPVDRLYSFYAHRMRETVTESFEEFVAHTDEAVESGKYMAQIRQFFAEFDERQLLILFTDDLRDHPQLVLDDLGMFLGLSPFDFTEAGPILANEGGGKHYAAASVTQSIANFKRAPLIEPILKCIPSSLRSAGYQWLADGPIGSRLRRRHLGSLSPMTSDMRLQLQQLYHEDICELEAHTGRNLSHWKGEVHQPC